ncbi:hypothetical protein CYY_005456 [Polysphondylium violaceum]|uniref:Multiple inositol polyphosphate phosphatase 1 n=1 Tax=Polysphondylium violaceum TaxID=133409 RepID=A0A8J4V6U4_9MYCE|nr:hypothetical protein CYY_005456 [Polysphondylium violaceum]
MYNYRKNFPSSSSFLLLFVFVSLLSSITSSTTTTNNLAIDSNQQYDFLSRHMTTRTPYWVLKPADQQPSSSDDFSSSDSSSSNDPIESKLKSKKIYLRDTTTTVESSNSDNSSGQEPSTCNLVHINFLARHGSRLPVPSALEELTAFTESLRPYVDQVSNEYKWIFNYTVPYAKKAAGNLILQGQYEHYNISKRLRSRYPSYFKPYSPQLYGIRSTAISRVGMSASAFSYGLFQGFGQLGMQNFEPVFIETSNLDQDRLLRFFDVCPRYQKMILDGQINKDEETKWNNQYFPLISQSVSKRLGLENIWDPTVKGMGNIFSACSYELSIENKTDGWCSLLDKDEILNWEYSVDLSTYWIKSYGNQVNYKISSILLQDMISTFDQFTNKTTSPPHGTTALRFGHAETIIPFLSLLGLYKDNFTLTANLTKQQIETRKFRTSIISPYASNVGFFLFDCGDDGFKIRVEHNELPVLIPGCDDVLCNYTQFKNSFPEVVDFNWDSYCSIKQPSPSENIDKKSKVFLSVFIPVAFIVGTMIGVVLILFAQKRLISKRRMLKKSNVIDVNSPLLLSSTNDASITVCTE